MLRMDNSLVAERHGSTASIEAFRSLRTFIRLRGIGGQENGYALLLVSPGAKEGKTTVLANLAVSFARDGLKTLVVDANFRHPALHEVLGTLDHEGLFGYLQEESALEDVIHPTRIENLSILPAGVKSSSMVEPLGSERMRELLAELRQSYDVILLDSPPLIEYADGRVLASFCDGAMLIARYGKSKRSSLKKANQLLQQAGANVLGITLNQAR